MIILPTNEFVGCGALKLNGIKQFKLWWLYNAINWLFAAHEFIHGEKE